MARQKGWANGAHSLNRFNFCRGSCGVRSHQLDSGDGESDLERPRHQLAVIDGIAHWKSMGFEAGGSSRIPNNAGSRTGPCCAQTQCPDPAPTPGVPQGPVGLVWESLGVWGRGGEMGSPPRIPAWVPTRHSPPRSLHGGPAGHSCPLASLYEGTLGDAPASPHGDPTGHSTAESLRGGPKEHSPSAFLHGGPTGHGCPLESLHGGPAGYSPRSSLHGGPTSHHHPWHPHTLVLQAPLPPSIPAGGHFGGCPHPAPYTGVPWFDVPQTVSPPPGGRVPQDMPPSALGSPWGWGTPPCGAGVQDGVQGAVGEGQAAERGEGSGTVDAFAQPLAKQLLSPRSHKTCLTCPAPLRQAAGNACAARGWGAPLRAAPGGVGPLLSPPGGQVGGCTHGVGDQELQGTLLPVGKPGARGCTGAMTLTGIWWCHGIAPPAAWVPTRDGGNPAAPHSPPCQGCILWGV